MSIRIALKAAIGHLEHMAAWITAENDGYSFEGLCEDMPGIKAAVHQPLAYVSDMTGRFLSEDLQRNLLDDSAFVGPGDFGPLGRLTADCYTLLEAARAQGDENGAKILVYMHERICRARQEISGDAFRELPERPYAQPTTEPA